MLTVAPKTAEGGRDATVRGVTQAVKQFEFQRKTSTTSGGRSSEKERRSRTLKVPVTPNAEKRNPDDTASSLTLAVQQFGFRKKASTTPGGRSTDVRR